MSVALYLFFSQQLFKGPIEHFGGDGGDFKNPLISLDPKYNSLNTYLDGIEVYKILLTFCMTIFFFSVKRS